MQKINYPKNRDNFHNVYRNLFNSDKKDEIDCHLSNIPYGKKVLKFDELVTLKFEDLVLLHSTIAGYSRTLNHNTFVKNKKGKDIITNKFEELFDYKSMQPKLAGFFMNQKSINLKSCCYCSLDYINSFADFPDYTNPIDFINNANKYELQYIKDLNENWANELIKNRNTTGYDKVEDTSLPEHIIEEIKKIPFSNSHNHFTLDHLFPQNSSKFYSLCLYNLVPSCYACNSKFKSSIEFEINSDLKYISPTSDDYSIPDNFHFRILFENELDKIISEKDFSLNSNVSNYEAHIHKYLRMFKIPGRYNFHKDEILKLINKRVKYSDSKIIELSHDAGMTPDEVKILLFGEELFNDDFLNQPLVKLKRDIAKNINIIKK